MSFQLIFSLMLAGAIGPFVAGLLAIIAGRSRGANTLVQSLFSVSAVAGIIGSAASFFQMTHGGMQPVLLGLPMLSINITIDAWSSIFLLLINIGTLLASLFAIGYLPKYEKTYSFPSLNFASALFLFGMQATVLASSVFIFLFFWEVMSIAAYFLVIADREEASLKAGFIYFVMTHLGAACLLAGLLILSKGQVMMSFAELQVTAGTLSPNMLALAFFLLFAGFGSKAGLVPLHQWLPYAHPQAPSHSSALMSGVMLKVALYGFIRLAIGVFPQIPLSWAIIVTVIGLVSAFFGVLYAAVETDLKRLLAWSSVENLGLIFAMIGLSLIFNDVGLFGTPFLLAALFHMFNHMIFKSGLFLSAGAIISETHTRNLDAMGGLAKKWPAFSAAFLGLVFGAAALPPFGTFYGEWITLQQLGSNVLQSTRVNGLLIALTMSVIALVGGLAVFTFGKVFSAIFLAKPRSEHAEHAHALSSWLVAPVIAAALLSLVMGVFASPIAMLLGSSTLPTAIQPLMISDGIIHPLILFFVMVVLGALVFFVRRFATSQRPIRVTETWDCGQPLTPRMEYTATGFASPIRFFFRSILLAEKRMVTERVTPENAWVLKRRLEWSVSSIWEKGIYEPLSKGTVWLATRIKRLQSGVIQFYILLVLVTLVIVLISASV